MVEKVKVGSISDIPEGKAKVIDAAGKQIAVFNKEGKFYAISNTCLHQGGPLGEGLLAGETVTCPWHAWEYDVKTGECLTTPGAKVEKFNVIVENNEVFVEV